MTPTLLFSTFPKDRTGRLLHPCDPSARVIILRRRQTRGQTSLNRPQRKCYTAWNYYSWRAFFSCRPVLQRTLPLHSYWLAIVQQPTSRSYSNLSYTSPDPPLVQLSIRVDGGMAFVPPLFPIRRASTLLMTVQPQEASSQTAFGIYQSSSSQAKLPKGDAHLQPFNSDTMTWRLPLPK